MLTDVQIERICQVYEEYESISKVTEVTGFNYRTVRKYLHQNGYEFSLRLKRTPIVLYLKRYDSNYGFESVTAAAKWLAKDDLVVQSRLLGNAETFQEGLDFKPRKLETHRRYLNSALAGELDTKVEWEIIENERI